MTLSPRLRRSLYAALLMSAMPFASAAKPAAATTPAAGTVASAVKVTNLQTRGTAEIDRRLTALKAVSEAVASAKKLPAKDKTALAGQIQDEVTALTSLKTKLAASTTLPVARADAASIETDYRVYSLMLPKARLVVAADRQAAAQTLLADLSNKLQTRVTAARSNGKNVAAAQSALAGMKAKLSAASTAGTDVSAGLLALQPADAKANRAALTGFRTALETAQTNLKGARADAQATATALKAIR